MVAHTRDPAGLVRRSLMHPHAGSFFLKYLVARHIISKMEKRKQQFLQVKEAQPSAEALHRLKRKKKGREGGGGLINYFQKLEQHLEQSKGGIKLFLP